MKKLLLIASAAAVLCAHADWEQKWVTPEIEALYDSETETLVVKGRGEIPWMPEGEFPRIKVAKNLIVTEGITTIGSYAFACRGGLLTNVVIEAGVEHIEDGAFAYQSKLRRIYMPEGLLTLGNIVFDECTALSALTIPDSVQQISYGAFRGAQISSLTFLGLSKPPMMEASIDRVFLLIQPGAHIYDFMSHPGDSADYLVDLKTSLKDGGVVIEPTTMRTYFCDLVLPDEWEVGDKVYPVKGIAAGAFKNCRELTSIRIPASVTSIGAEAFSGCSALKSIRFLGDKPSIAADSFAGVSSAVYRMRSGKGWDTASKTWGGAEGLYYHEFGPSEWVMEVAGDDGDKYARVMPNPTKEMTGDLKIPSTWEIDGINYPVREIGWGAFWNCAGITSICVPASIQRIENSAFSGCSGLTRIRFEGDRPSIEDCYPFNGMTATVYYPPSKDGWTETDANWGGATCLTYKPYEGVPTDFTELMMAIGDIEGTGEITLSPTGCFSDETVNLVIPEGKSVTIDLQGQVLNPWSLTLNGILTLIDTSAQKTGWIKYHWVQAGEQGHLSFEGTSHISSIAEFDEICALNKLGATLLAKMDSDIVATWCLVPAGVSLVLDLDGHVFRSAMNVDGSLVVRDTSEEKCGFVAGRIEKREGANLTLELDGNIAGVSTVNEINFVAELNAMGADIDVLLLTNIEDDPVFHVTIPEDVSMTIYTNDHWINGWVDLRGELYLVYDSGYHDGGIDGPISCAEGSHIEGQFDRILDKWSGVGYSHYIGPDECEGEGSFKESIDLIKAGAVVTDYLYSDIKDTFEIPEGKSLTIDLQSYTLSGQITVNGTLKVERDNWEEYVGKLKSDLIIGPKGKVEMDFARAYESADELKKALNLTCGQGPDICLGANMTCDELVIPEGAVQTIDLNGFSLTCKTLKVLGALTLIDSKGSDGFVKADRTLLGRKGSMKIDYGPVRTTYTYLNPGLMLLVK